MEKENILSHSFYVEVVENIGVHTQAHMHELHMHIQHTFISMINILVHLYKCILTHNYAFTCIHTIPYLSKTRSHFLQHP